MGTRDYENKNNFNQNKIFCLFSREKLVLGYTVLKFQVLFFIELDSFKVSSHMFYQV